jgi:hypothetical protein
MPKGSTSLFSEILFDYDNESLAAKAEKGRSKDLIAKRNELLVDRYFFYLKNFHYRYDHIIDLLSDEFFLSEVTIPKILSLSDNLLYLRRLKKEPPPLKSFKEKWPHLQWAA